MDWERLPKPSFTHNIQAVNGGDRRVRGQIHIVIGIVLPTKSPSKRFRLCPYT